LVELQAQGGHGGSHGGSHANSALWHVVFRSRQLCTCLWGSCARVRSASPSKTAVALPAAKPSLINGQSALLRLLTLRAAHTGARLPTTKSKVRAAARILLPRINKMKQQAGGQH
jgi:hypothetical protein